MYWIANSRFRQFDYEQWIRYFQHNYRRKLELDFSTEPELTDKERKLIIPSVAAFQKGEHSEGKYFLKAAEKFAGEYNEPFYPEAVRKFIMEENLHSAYLGQFMKYHDIVPARESRLDGIFRKLRHIWGIHSETAVLLNAEIIALTYYRALEIVTDSHALKLICRQMLHTQASIRYGHSSICTPKASRMRSATHFSNTSCQTSTAPRWKISDTAYLPK
ncbi:hypothetical protein I6E09_09055 [Mediterraneibacter glycyrrhizinilyticus]|uniref:hypothetical protein n=1 Tax=Mediterraneibacter glycyrrhizinilyticus TaxID=342942 RepID=UPI0026585F7F|nr:hypothetical protein [Mediterraneibacter glycyrrhizinilyticus]MCF2569313.1 hypothetical protein [Mediterraneibacter glycyrrhizinilyticus]